MTKPSDFILNTDFLALAQVSRTEFTAYFPQQTFTSGAHNLTQDFPVKANQGAIDDIYISRNNADYTAGNEIIKRNIDGGNVPYFSIMVYRTNPSTMRVRLHIFADATYTMPAQTVKVKLSSFKAPNIF